MNALDGVADRMSSEIASSPQPSQTEPAPESRTPSESTQSVAQALAELDKMEKFKFQGQEWTPKDLEKAIMRQQDYSKKTQGLSDDRKSLDDERKFYENLAYDLVNLRTNPSLVNKFLQLYPEKFHKYADEFLKGTPSSTQTQGAQTPNQPIPDVQLLSRLDKLEKFYQEQEVTKNEAKINEIVTSMSKKYPDAANFKEMVLGRAYESHMQGVQLTDETWESIFKSVNDEVGNMIKAKYGELVKKQTEANSKARDVAPGGGIATRAPQKIALKDVAQIALQDLQGRGA